MPDSNPEIQPRTAGPFTALLKSLPTIIVLAVMGTGWLAMHHINSGETHSEVDEEPSEDLVHSDVLVLPAGKLEAARFESEAAGSQVIQHVHTVPGRLRYDQAKHVDVKTPMDGILTELLVSPGDQVDKGDLIAVIRSPEIGQARAEILKRQKDRDIAQKILNRESTVSKNLSQFIEVLDQGQSVESIENAFSNRALGSYRQRILSAYSKMRLADDLVTKVRPLVASGSVSGRTVREREGQRQLAETEYRTARDEAKYEIEKAVMKAEADVADAERQLSLAWQSLETLLGYHDGKEVARLGDEDSLARLEVRAPFTGSVESRGFATNERVMRGDSLIVLANTDSLWVEASIRESDWPAVTLKPGTPIEVVVPAVGDQSFGGEVKYFGREVQANTNSVPLVAQIDNRKGILRPGMFVRVTVPMGEARQALSVKPESLLHNNDEHFVFVETNAGRFRKVNIETGNESERWVEVTRGLSPGQLVVTDGAFLLKSELLLQGEGE